MTLRFIDAAADLDRALSDVERAIAAWSADAGEPWVEEGSGGERLRGMAYGAAPEIDLYVMRSPRRAALGVSLSGGDRDLARFEFDRRAPGRERRRLAMALDRQRSPYLLVSEAALAAQGLHAPFQRLAGAPDLRRARAEGCEYLLVGPLDQDGGPQALVAVASLSSALPPARTDDAAPPLLAHAPPRSLYAMAASVACSRRARARALHAVRERCRSAAFAVSPADGAAAPDCTAAREDRALAFAVCGDAEIDTVLRALGRLVVATRTPGLRRVLVVPAPEQGAAAVEGFLEAGLQDLGAALVFYEFAEADARMWLASAEASDDLRRLFG